MDSAQELKAIALRLRPDGTSECPSERTIDSFTITISIWGPAFLSRSLYGLGSHQGVGPLLCVSKRAISPSSVIASNLPMSLCGDMPSVPSCQESEAFCVTQKPISLLSLKLWSLEAKARLSPEQMLPLRLLSSLYSICCCPRAGPPVIVTLERAQ